MSAATAPIRQRVQSTPAAIGYVGLGFVDRSVKALEIDGVVPDMNTISSGIYPIARPLFMFTNGYPKLGQPSLPFHHALPDTEGPGDRRGDRLRPGYEVLGRDYRSMRGDRLHMNDRIIEHTDSDIRSRLLMSRGARRYQARGRSCRQDRPDHDSLELAHRAPVHLLLHHQGRRPLLPARRIQGVLHEHALVPLERRGGVRRPGDLRRHRAGDAGSDRRGGAAGRARGALPERHPAVLGAPGRQAGDRDAGRDPVGRLRLLRAGRIRAAAAGEGRGDAVCRGHDRARAGVPDRHRSSERSYRSEVQGEGARTRRRSRPLPSWPPSPLSGSGRSTGSSAACRSAAARTR